MTKLKRIVIEIIPDDIDLNVSVDTGNLELLEVLGMIELAKDHVINGNKVEFEIGDLN